MRKLLLVAALASALAAPASAQFVPYFGKNKVKYDNFGWRIYKSPHFDIYYYPELETHLASVASYAESAYQKISSDLKHSIQFSIPLILYKTHSEFEQTNLYPDFVPEGVAAFAEPTRNRMVLPVDWPPDRLQGLITHEMTHIFEFDLIPRSLIQRQVPLWVDEGLADYERAVWDNFDLMTLRDAAVTDQVPRLSRLDDLGQFSNPRVVYNLGHACFEFMEAKWGKEGIRQFLYMFRKNIASGGMEEIYHQAFRIKPDEFDQQFERWLKERFKPYRDKQQPSDYGKRLSPDDEKTPFTQVFAFSPSPSGDIVAVLTGNRGEGEADVVLLSSKDGAVIRNLTKGYTSAFENITSHERFVAGRTIAFDPRGDHVAFFARQGKRRSLYLVSVLSGKIVRRVPMELDEAQAPCLLPDGRHALFVALKDGVSDVYLVDMETHALKNLTQDAIADDNPQISPDGNLVVYTRRVSGYEKIYMFPLNDPSRRTQLTFGAFDDEAPIFSSDGSKVFYSSSEDNDIPNLRSVDLNTGAVKQYTDVLGGNMAPAPINSPKGPERIGFVTYYKSQFHLHTVETTEALKEVDQDVQVADDSLTEFQPDVQHHVLPENKRRKGLFEKLSLEGRPPLNIGVTSSGDFFGGSQAALSDVLGDQNFIFTASSQREFRSYDAAYYNLGRRLQWGASAFDTTQFFYAAPYDLVVGFSREGALATQRYTGGTLHGVYPFDKFRRLEMSAGFLQLREQFEDSLSESLARQAAAQQGVPFILNNGKIAPLSVRFVQETTRFREFGPLTGSTLMLGVEVSPGFGNLIERQVYEVDARKYLQLFGDVILASRVRGFKSTGPEPGLFYFGGNMELRGYPYYSMVGNEGFHANLELRLPAIQLMATPIGILGPVRATLYGGVGAAKFKGEDFHFSSRAAGFSYVNDVLFGEPVEGFHLVDGRASYGVGLQVFFLGYPLHFDWTKLTDFKVSSQNWKFDFWIGYDF
jgi:Tol biopolymer transport system component